MTVYTSGQLVKLTTVWDDKGVVSEHIQLGLESGLFADVGDLLVSGNPIDRETIRQAFGLSPLQLLTVVDYGLTLEQMIVAGRYDWTNSDITSERFPVKGAGKMEYENKIFHFGRNISSEEATRLIIADDTSNPWKPWKTEQSLAYGTKYPDDQMKGPLVGLGSSAELDGNRNVLILFKVGSRRYLRLHGWRGDWSGHYRFGASRKRLVTRPSGK